MAKPAQAERSHCPATRPRVCAAFDSAPQAHHGAGTDAGDPPAGGRNTAADRAGRAGPRAQPTDPAGRSRRQASAGRAGGAESPPAPAIGITRPIKRGRAAASRAAHGGEGGA